MAKLVEAAKSPAHTPPQLGQATQIKRA
jgi:hypothetical protein